MNAQQLRMGVEIPNLVYLKEEEPLSVPDRPLHSSPKESETVGRYELPFQSSTSQTFHGEEELEERGIQDEEFIIHQAELWEKCGCHLTTSPESSDVDQSATEHLYNYLETLDEEQTEVGLFGESETTEMFELPSQNSTSHTFHGEEELEEQVIKDEDFLIHQTEIWEKCGCHLMVSPESSVAEPSVTDSSPTEPSLTEHSSNYLETPEEERERKSAELQEFLKELACFKEQLRKKNTRDKDVEVLPRHLDKFAKDMRALEEATKVDEFLHTKYTQKLWSLHAKLKKAIKKKAALQMIMKQEEGIRVIRAKMKEAEEAYLHQQSKKEMKLEKALGTVSVDLKDFSVQKRIQLAERVISVKKIRHLQRLGRQKRYEVIAKKLASEDRRAKEIEAAKNKRYDYKVKRKAKVLKMTRSSEVLHMSDEWEIIEEEVVEEAKPEEVVIEVVEEKEKKKDKKKNKRKDKKEKNKDKKSKKSSKSSKKKSEQKKKTKGKKKEKVKSIKGELEDLIFPQAPITNPRQKISPENVQMLIDLVKDYTSLVQILEDQDAYDKAHAKRELKYQHDGSFYWIPNPIIFKNFQKGKIYKKRITIINGGEAPKKCKLHKIEMEDGFDSIYFKIDTTDVQYTIPGLSFKVTATFSPENLDRPAQGKITMMTYRPHGPYYGQFSIPIKCLPINDSIVFHPKILDFGKVVIWRAKGRNKTLKITNPGQKVHRVVIKRLHEINLNQNWEDPNFDLGESSLDQNFVHEETPSILTESELLRNLFNAFHFSSYFLEILPNTEETLIITFKNPDHIGCYLERYTCDIYEKSGEDDFQLIGSEELLVTAEAIGHFLRLCPHVLDFDQCVFDSAYQRNFQVHNDDGVAHKVRVKIPACLRDYISTNVGEACLHAFGHQDISLRLIPRKEMLIDRDISRYFDDQTAILEFPVRVGLSPKNLDDTPWLVITVYAVIGESAGVALAPVDLKQASREQNNFLIDLGECTTAETVWTTIAVTNHSCTQQHFGFLDLPQCIFLEPNFGFGVLEPMETKILNVMLSPEVCDLEGPHTFKISANTIKELGSIRKAFNYHKLRKSLEMVETILESHGEVLLEKNMVLCAKLISDQVDQVDQVERPPELDVMNLSVIQDVSNADSDSTKSESLVPPIPNNSRETSKTSLEQGWDNRTNTILIRCTIIDPLCTLSHQRVIFPSIPCGSYSIANVHLSAKNLSKLGAYRAKFKIVGDNEQFRVEPTCGELKNGEVTKITLIARPELPQELIDIKAAFIQREKLIEKKREEHILKREKELSKAREKDEKKKKKGKKTVDKTSEKKKKKGKKGENKSSKAKKVKKGKSKSSEENEKGNLDKESEPKPLPSIIIDDKDIVITYWDLYPAEMCLWREFESYSIFGLFTCEVSYESSERKPEKLYLSVTCHVIQPDFVHNSNLQHLHFGPTPLGMARKKIFEVQNIKYHPIKPKITRPCPIGPFTCPDTSRIKLPPEHRLQLPITFRPLEQKEIFEYIEIVSDKTICPLILSGEGVKADVIITPEFLVCRLEASPNGFTDLTLEVKNRCAGSVLIKFDKICEIEGVMKEVEDKQKEEKKKKAKKGSEKKSKKGSQKKSEKSSKKKSSKSSKGKKLNKFSNQLSESEVYSLSNFFQNREGQSLFELVSGNSVEIPAESKQVVKLRFGVTPPPTTGKKDKGKGKSGKNTKGKKEKSSGGSKKSNKSKKSRKSERDGGKFYAAKFNVMIGGSTFLKDFIILGNFV